MRALSAELIALLELSLQHGATRVDMTDDRLRLFRGDEVFGESECPPGAADRVRDDLRAFGARSANPTEIEVQSPVGPLRFTAQLTATVTRLTFATTVADARAEALMSEVLQQLAAVGGDRVTCSYTSAVFHRGSKELDRAISLDGRYEVLLAHGRKLAGLAEDAVTGTGSAALVSGRQLRIVRIEVGAETVTFTIDR